MDIAEKLLKRPDALIVLRHIQESLQNEAVRRHEFREWVDENTKAEFINGEIILHSPVKQKHLEVTRLLGGMLHVYALLKKKGTVWTEKAMITLTRNDYEPDIVFFSQDRAILFEKDQLFFPAPDFVVEILSSKTAQRDRGIKKQDYAAHGIREYWIIDPERQRIEQYLLLTERDTVYFEPYVFGIDDPIKSVVIEGFQVPVRAIFEAEANAQVLAQLMASSSK